MDGDGPIEINGPPTFALGEKVRARKYVKNDGTFPGHEIGQVLVGKGDVGLVVSIGTFLQQFYVYGVDFYDKGMVVGMREREIVSLDRVGAEGGQR
jgi:nitrogen fixation protein NifZ